MYQLHKNHGTFSKTSCLALTLILLLSLASYGYGNGWIDSPRLLSDAEAAGLVGGLQIGACGIVAGIGIGVLALGLAGVSVGFGAAAVISVGAHIAAAICIDA
jgi:hypothetical protein